MKKILFLIIVLSIAAIQFGCEDKSTEPYNDIDDNDTSSVIVRKPNLYIYPTEEISLFVKVDFPNGGSILESIPKYDDGWEISVKPNGIINDIYEYLFYECKVPDLSQNNYGWIIAQDELKQFFVNNLSSSGFNEKEIKDFTDYWIPILINYRYYEIYPQYKRTLEKMSIINFSIEPKNIFRLQYVLKGRNDKNKTLLTPRVEKAKREEYFSVEWGVIIK